MKIWAHRGASQYAPENTMEAFQLAISQGSDGIETDVHLTKDGQLVIMHDERIDRTTDGKGFIKDYTYKTLQTFNANYQHADYPFCHIPLLAELLALVKKNGIYLNIELKTDVIQYPGIENKVLALVKEYDLLPQVIFSSFNHYSLMKLRELDQSVKIGLLYMEGLYKPWHYAKSLDADALHPYYPCCELDDYIQNAHAHHLSVHPWTVNDKDIILKLKAADVDAIITNDPRLALSLK